MYLIPYIYNLKWEARGHELFTILHIFFQLKWANQWALVCIKIWIAYNDFTIFEYWSSEIPDGLSICALISENEDLEKRGSISNRRKILGLAKVLQVSTLKTISLKKSRFAETEFFLLIEIGLDFTRPWFLEI